MAVLQRDELTVRHLPHKLSALTERSNRDLSSLDLIKADPHNHANQQKNQMQNAAYRGTIFLSSSKPKFLAESFMAYAG